MSDGVEWAIHTCVNLAVVGDDRAAVPTSRLAGFYELPAPYLNKVLQGLVRNGILASRSGPRGGFRLDRPAEQITLLDVVDAVEGTEPVFRCQEIRQRGPAGDDPGNHAGRCAIAIAFDDAEHAWRQQLGARTIADLSRALQQNAPSIVTQTHVALGER